MTAPARTLGALLAGLDAELIGVDASLRVDAITGDSRAVRAGSVFVALAGGRVDGHAFIVDALERGASVVVLERVPADVPPNTPMVKVASTSVALPDLAANRWGRPGRSLRAWGLTGTNGKTTTAHLLGSIFSDAGLAHARLGTTGNWLVDHEVPGAFTTPFPLELQRLLADAVDSGANELVMEVSSHALDQDRVAPLRYAGAALTSFSQDHLDYHATMQAYLDAKLRLVRNYLADDALVVAPCRAGPSGAGARAFVAAGVDVGARTLGIVRDDDELASLPTGVSPTRLSDVRLDAGRIRFEIELTRLCGGTLELDAPMVGDFNVDNLAVAAVLAASAGVDLETIAAALARTPGAPGRLERVVVPGLDDADLPAVFVDYAHTPDAVARALSALRPHTAGRLIVVLGCGGDRDRAKRAPMGAAATRGADVFWATSDNPRTEDPGAIVDAMLAGVTDVPESQRAQLRREVARERAIAAAISDAGAADTILLAGKGHEDYQVVGTTKRDFDDREHAAAALLRRARDR